MAWLDGPALRSWAMVELISLYGCTAEAELMTSYRFSKFCADK